MMNQLHKITWISEEDYLEGEMLANRRHEYLDGQVYAMAGANARHNLIALNVAVELRTATRGKGCQVFINDMKLRISEQRTFYYPDVMLCCDPQDNHELYREHPCLIVEVLSKSTATIDRREKLLAYQGIASLRYYLLVAANKMQVEFYQRAVDGNWYVGTLGAEETLEIQCSPLNTMTLSWEDFYQEVPLP